MFPRGMRFQILKPPAPLDPRSLEFTSLEALLERCPPVEDSYQKLYSEDEATAITRGMCPDSIPMPMLVRVGSGNTVLMGFLDEYKDKVLDKDAILPFTLFVRPVPEHGKDQRLLKQHAAFDPKKWRPNVKHPTAGTARPHKVEIRSTDMQTPVDATALVGKTANGVPVINISVNGVAMSITFDEAHEIRVTDPPSKLVDNGSSVGSSYDPNPW